MRKNREEGEEKQEEERMSEKEVTEEQAMDIQPPVGITYADKAKNVVMEKLEYKSAHNAPWRKRTDHPRCRRTSPMHGHVVLKSLGGKSQLTEAAGMDGRRADDSNRLDGKKQTKRQ